MTSKPEVIEAEIVEAPPKKKKHSTRSKLNKAMVNEIVDKVTKGWFKKDIAAHVGVSYSTMMDYLNPSQGRTVTPLIAELRDRVGRAEAYYKGELMDRLERSGDTRALMYLLSVKFPRQFREKKELEVSAKPAINWEKFERLPEAEREKILAAYAITEEAEKLLSAGDDLEDE